MNLFKTLVCKESLNDCKEESVISTSPKPKRQCKDEDCESIDDTQEEDIVDINQRNLKRKFEKYCKDFYEITSCTFIKFITTYYGIVENKVKICKPDKDLLYKTYYEDVLYAFCNMEEGGFNFFFSMDKCIFTSYICMLSMDIKEILLLDHKKLKYVFTERFMRKFYYHYHNNVYNFDNLIDIFKSS